MKIISEKDFKDIGFECGVCDTQFLASRGEYTIADKREKIITVKDSGFFPWQKGLWTITPTYFLSASCPKCGTDCTALIPAGDTRTTNVDPYFDWG